MRVQNSDLIPQYKQQIPKPPKWVILHYGYNKVIWDWFLLLFILYTASAVPFQFCFDYEAVPMTVIDFLVDTFFLTDIVLNFHTSFVGEDGEVITDMKQIRHYYLRTWFALDLVTSLPYGLLVFVSNNTVRFWATLQHTDADNFAGGGNKISKSKRNLRGGGGRNLLMFSSMT